MKDQLSSSKIQRRILEESSRNPIYTSEVIQPAYHIDISIYIYTRNGIVVPKILYSDTIDLIPYCFDKIALLLSGIP